MDEESKYLGTDYKADWNFGTIGKSEADSTPF
jgi:hypothetical protein